MEFEEDENEPRIDILACLVSHNLGHVIDGIVEYSSHSATVSLMCVCKSWRDILRDFVPFKRIVRLR